MSEWIYDGRFLKASSKVIRVFSRTYPLHRVEKIGVRRDPFYMGLGVLLPLLGFAFAFNEYLYTGEKIAIYGGSLLALTILSRLGVLYVQAGSTYAPAAVWKLSELRKFHDAVETII